MTGSALQRHARALIGSALAIVLLAGGVAFAVGTIPDGDGVIHGCYNNMKGALRVIDPTTTSCNDRETAISWNQQGPQGEQGVQGEPGAPGAPGDSLVGSACELPDGSAGTIDMDVAGDGTISFTCDVPEEGGGGDPISDASLHDIDSDGYAYTDCDDSDPAVHPGASDLDGTSGGGDGFDNDCDGQVDEVSGDIDTIEECNDGNPYTDDVVEGDVCANLISAQLDRDGDGFDAYDHPADGPDCDDSDAAIYPGAVEIANGLDDDCDGELGSRTAYSGPPGTEGVGECIAGTQYETSDGQWSEIVGEITPTTEIEDGLDNDCDGSTDEDFQNPS